MGLQRLGRFLELLQLPLQALALLYGGRSSCPAVAGSESSTEQCGDGQAQRQQQREEAIGACRVCDQHVAAPVQPAARYAGSSVSRIRFG